MHTKYRQGVGAMILNPQNQIFVARRMDKASGLQMPQGGTEVNEKLETTLYRELKEEIGTDTFKIVRKLDFPLYYDFPLTLANKLYNGEYLGQSIHWFVVKFEGDDKDIDLETAHREFSDWEWSDHTKLVDNVVAFKKTMYQTLVEAFKPLLI